MGVTFISFAEDGTLLTKTIKSDYNAKVYPMVCDRLTLTCDIPNHLKLKCIEIFQQEDSKPYGLYRCSGLIKNIPMHMSPYMPDEDDKITSATIQCDPYDSDINFIRLDFNPAKIEITDLKWGSLS